MLAGSIIQFGTKTSVWRLPRSMRSRAAAAYVRQSMYRSILPTKMHKLSLGRDVHEPLLFWRIPQCLHVKYNFQQHPLNISLFVTRYNKMKNNTTLSEHNPFSIIYVKSAFSCGSPNFYPKGPL